jgi:hypothetical protein
MRRRTFRQYAWSAVAGLVVGLGVPRLELIVACGRAVSESCVWGRALLPVFEVACLVFLGLPTFFLVRWYLAKRTR